MGYFWGSFGVFVWLRSSSIMVTRWLSRGCVMTVTVVRGHGNGGISHCWRAKRRCSLPRRRAPRVPLWALCPAGGCAPPASGFKVIQFATSGHKNEATTTESKSCLHMPRTKRLLNNKRFSQPQELLSVVNWGAPLPGWVKFYEGGRPAAGHAGGEDPLAGAGPCPPNPVRGWVAFLKSGSPCGVIKKKGAGYRGGGWRF